MKDFFGWLLSIQRRKVQVSNENSKTQRAFYSISIILMLYTTGVLSSFFIILNSFIGLDFFKNISLGKLIGNTILASGVLSLGLFKLIYKKETLDYYVEKYEPIDEVEDNKQRKQALFFVLGGFIAVASPFIINWLVS